MSVLHAAPVQCPNDMQGQLQQWETSVIMSRESNMLRASLTFAVGDALYLIINRGRPWQEKRSKICIPLTRTLTLT
jgi:hypothetical protein